MSSKTLKIGCLVHLSCPSLLYIIKKQTNLYLFYFKLFLVVERPETNLDQKYQAPINEVSSIINDPNSMSQSIVSQNVSVSRHGDLLQHQSQQNSINGNTIL